MRPTKMTRDHVLWAYRILLGRDPESEVVIQQKLSRWTTPEELCADFMSSPEFALANPSHAPYSLDPLIVIKETDDGLRLFLDLSDMAVGLNIAKQQYEQDEMKFMRRSVKPGQTAIDVGAHVGFYTIALASCVGPTGRVYAFEPFERCYELLKRSILENRFNDRVTLTAGAVGETTGEARLVVIHKTLNSGGSYRFREDVAVPPGHDVINVPLLALDSHGIRRPVSFIKVDVEGSEPFVFRGAEKILKEDRPIVLSELHPEQLKRVCGMSPSRFIGEMRGRGYECRAIQDGIPTDVLTDSDRLMSVAFLPLA